MILSKKNTNKLLKLLLIISLIIDNIDNNYVLHYRDKNFIKHKTKESYLKIFVMTHKDFVNYRYNSVYNIVVDNKSLLKNKYNLNVIYANEGKLYNMSRAYGEMAKIYFIYQLYKNGTISSKYIGTNHYRRYFDFTDNIPDLDEIFKKFDVILNSPVFKTKTIREGFCEGHICEIYDDMMNIIKDIRPEYYESAKKVSMSLKRYYCNIFIMKKEDFFKYCEFTFDILFELDKRKNFTCDRDVLEYTKKYFNDSRKYFRQARMQGFLAERISNIFYYQNFKRIKTYKVGNYKISYKINN